MSSAWLFWALLAAVFAALTAILAKVGVSAVDPDLATLVRTLVILALLAGFLAATGRLRAVGSLPGRTYLWLALSGVATGASWVCYFRALKLGQASQVAPIDKLSVVLVAILAALFLGEKLSAAGWTGVAMIAGGAILLARG
ncbi:EamA family transporter [Pseudoruegeria sp. HB172150]|uniref:EamA family transporter n=1 Tax=Pseudoruegeria sp. HB172150 TaxID=2721164 RepID=UPI001C12ED56|nr:EamA family transporter [Pseudoruegeria sp. HB172150]